MTEHDWREDGTTSRAEGFVEIPRWKCAACGMVVSQMFETPTAEALRDREWPATCEEFRVAEVMRS